METTKQERLLEIFFRSLRGEGLSVQRIADEYGVSTKSIGRDIADLKAFLSEHREMLGNAELQYSSREKCYYLNMEDFLTSGELFSLVEVMIGSRAFSKEELLLFTDKLRRFTTAQDGAKLNELIRRELYHYSPVKHDCDSVQETLWQLANCITEHREISIDYYRMDRAYVTHRVFPATVMFTDHYFYLIAFKVDDERRTPTYFRVDRIKHITVHRSNLSEDTPKFDEGELRNRSLFMWPGKLRTIRFEFTGPSVQAMLDKLPTAKIIERIGSKYLIEAEVYGDGIKMWLLSQGSWVKVIAPQEFVDEMIDEIEAMKSRYAHGGV